MVIFEMQYIKSCKRLHKCLEQNFWIYKTWSHSLYLMKKKHFQKHMLVLFLLIRYLISKYRKSYMFSACRRLIKNNWASQFYRRWFILWMYHKIYVCSCMCVSKLILCIVYTPAFKRDELYYEIDRFCLSAFGFGFICNLKHHIRLSGIC